MDQRNFLLKKGLGLLLLLFFQIACSIPGKMEDAEAIFQKALLLYEKGRYDDAAAQYALLLDRGIESGPLYYNLGNCYLQKGELGRAILNYERARKIVPHDRDLLANHAYAKSLARGGAETSRAWHERLVAGLIQWASADGLALLLSGIYTSFFLILIASWHIRAVRRCRIHLLLVLAVIFVLALVQLSHRISLEGTAAIIIADMAEVKFQPFDRAPAHFIAREGMNVKVLLSTKEWVKIERSDGKTGWVRKTTVEVI